MRLRSPARVAALPWLLALLMISGCQQTPLSSQIEVTKPSPEAPLQPLSAGQPPPPSAAPLAQVQSQVLPRSTPPASGVMGPAAPTTAVPATAAPAPAAPTHFGARAALLVPLSGPDAALGKVLSNAAQLAVFEVAGPKFNLLPIDTKGTAAGAAAAAQQAVDDKANIILGPLFSTSVAAVAQVVAGHSIPVVAFTTNRSVLGNGVYSLGFLPEAQIQREVSLAITKDHRQRFAILAPDDEYGHAMASALTSVVTADGAQVTRAQFYDPTAKDFAGAARTFTDYYARGGTPEKVDTSAIKLPYDAVLLPDDGIRLKTIASLVSYYGIVPGSVRFLGTMRWDGANLSDEPALQGAWYPALPKTGPGAFAARYAKAFGPLPAGLAAFAGNAYDATALAAVLAREGEGDYPQSALTNPDGFAGVDGIFRLLPNGICQRGLAVRQVGQNGSTTVSPALTSFPAPPAAATPAVDQSPAPSGFNPQAGSQSPN